MRLAFCNYYGMCDEEGKVLGHPTKITTEYFDLLKDDFTISLYASPCIVNETSNIMFDEVVKLSYDIRIDEKFTILKRIKDKVKILKNISLCLKSKEDRKFFLQVDFFFFFYLLFFHKKRKDEKIFCLIYHQNFTGGKLERLLQKIYQKALEKVDGVFYTQKNNPPKHRNAVWIPDFYYDEARYGKYRNMPKYNQVACLGTMNRYKQLEELIAVWEDDMPKLIISGRFDDKDRCASLRMLVAKKSCSNIIIEDQTLDDDAYYTLMGTSKFGILPYDSEQYKDRTSGVILETCFVGSIPICPNNIMENTDVKGLGYNELVDIKDKLLSDDVDISILTCDSYLATNKDYYKTIMIKLIDGT